MKSNSYNCYAHRMKLEKMKQKTWRLIVLAKFLFLLVNLAAYLRRT